MPAAVTGRLVQHAGIDLPERIAVAPTVATAAVGAPDSPIRMATVNNGDMIRLQDGTGPESLRDVAAPWRQRGRLCAPLRTRVHRTRCQTLPDIGTVEGIAERNTVQGQEDEW